MRETGTGTAEARQKAHLSSLSGIYRTCPLEMEAPQVAMHASQEESGEADAFHFRACIVLPSGFHNYFFFTR